MMSVPSVFTLRIQISLLFRLYRFGLLPRFGLKELNPLAFNPAEVQVGKRSPAQKVLRRGSQSAPGRGAQGVETAPARVYRQPRGEFQGDSRGGSQRVRGGAGARQGSQPLE